MAESDAEKPTRHKGYGMFEYEMHQERHAELIREAERSRLLREVREARKAARAARRSARDEGEGRVSTQNTQGSQGGTHGGSQEPRRSQYAPTA
ncbi:hypothetical protein H1V43_33435 [Streptomyces sp. PSKA54]|uniref:Uncharacterized protein n=2 Tax=Streptomyces TaxID=1883 RepID=A0A7W2D7E3_9ACTN|nr:hypothetical protein [Streptomyces himalayensis subsp. aureolus]